jgi:predicted ester cyclase
MSAQENKAFIRQYFDALNKEKSAATVDQYVADSDEELKQHIAFFDVVFPNYQLVAEDMIAEGDKIVVRGVVRGTHKGDLMGIPPTGKQVEFPLMLIYRVAGGKIVEHWMVADQLSLMQQLGAIPEPEPAGD